jgi:ankyrin repeat protein
VSLEFKKIWIAFTHKDFFSSLALHGAGFQGRPRIAKLLIDHGLDPLDMHKDGYLPIHRACWGREKRHTLTVKTFIDNGGVRHDAASEDGKTCKDVTNNPETLQLLDGVASKEKEDEL